MLAECFMVLSGHLFEGMKATYHHLVLLNALLRQRNTYTWCWPWRPARVRILRTSWARHLFGYMMAVYHPPGIAGEVVATSEPAQAQQCVDHARRGDHTLASLASLGIYTSEDR